MSRPKYYYILTEYGRDYYTEADSFSEACRKCGLDPKLTKVKYRTEE